VLVLDPAFAGVTGGNAVASATRKQA
jgi:hypothetical protein